MLQADIIGALFVLGFLRYGLPPQDRIQLQDLPALNLTIFGLSLMVVVVAGWVVNLRLLVPVFRWQRRDNLLSEADPAATALARSRALRMPFYRTITSVVSWCIGGAIFVLASWSVAKYAAPVVTVATALGAAATSIIGYLQSERVLRPVAVAALRSGVPENVKAPGVILRQLLTWTLSTAVPVLAIVTRLPCCVPPRSGCSPRSCCWPWRRWASASSAPCWWPCRSPTRCVSCAGH
jgi:adenylate cyclase